MQRNANSTSTPLRWPSDFPSEDTIEELLQSDKLKPGNGDISVVLFNAIREDPLLDVDDVFAADASKHFTNMVLALDYLWAEFTEDADKTRRNQIKKLKKALLTEKESFIRYFTSQQNRIDRYETAAGETYERGRIGKRSAEADYEVPEKKAKTAPTPTDEAELCPSRQYIIEQFKDCDMRDLETDMIVDGVNMSRTFRQFQHSVYKAVIDGEDILMRKHHML
ncbi:hypothetical protein DFS34DRAFT_6 [Phlyctochytrium arcticum]|nr:hypothetical protein DFS34DRAFT_6 [Phlyctochytrium arcticum]